MFICPLVALKESSKKKETKINKEIVEVLQREAFFAISSVLASCSRIFTIKNEDT